MEKYKDKQLSAYERAAALADTLSTEEQAQQLKYDAPAIERQGFRLITGGTRGFTVWQEQERLRFFRRLSHLRRLSTRI